jgi:hypothetical protein
MLRLRQAAPAYPPVIDELAPAARQASKTAIQRIVKVTRTGLRSHKWALGRYRWPAPSGVVTSAA